MAWGMGRPGAWQRRTPAHLGTRPPPPPPPCAPAAGSHDQAHEWPAECARPQGGTPGMWDGVSGGALGS